MEEVPLINAYLYMKIRENTNGYVIRAKDLKHILQLFILCSKEENGSWKAGGNRKGLPRCFMYPIIKELEEYGLLKRLDNFPLDRTCYEILVSNCGKKLKRYLW